MDIFKPTVANAQELIQKLSDYLNDGVIYCPSEVEARREHMIGEVLTHE